MTGNDTLNKIQIVRFDATVKTIKTNGAHNPMTNFNKHNILIEVSTYKKQRCRIKNVYVLL